MLPVAGKRARGLQRFDGWGQAGVGSSLAWDGLVSSASGAGASRKPELRWEQAAEKVPRRNFSPKLQIDVLR